MGEQNWLWDRMWPRALVNRTERWQCLDLNRKRTPTGNSETLFALGEELFGEKHESVSGIEQDAKSPRARLAESGVRECTVHSVLVDQGGQHRERVQQCALQR